MRKRLKDIRRTWSFDKKMFFRSATNVQIEMAVLHFQLFDKVSIKGIGRRMAIFVGKLDLFKKVEENLDKSLNGYPVIFFTF